MVLAPQPSTEELALMLRDRYQPEDQIVMLERYRYDLNFYAGIAKPALVVSNWDDPELKHQDNWRKELYDRSEEHTSELQSLMRISYAVFCLKKKKSKIIDNNIMSFTN